MEISDLGAEARTSINAHLPGTLKHPRPSGKATSTGQGSRECRPTQLMDHSFEKKKVEVVRLFFPVALPDHHHLTRVSTRDPSILTSHRYRKRATAGINHHTTLPSQLTQLWVQAQDLSAPIPSPWTPSSPRI